jgi:DNA-binding LytR/AlgR family response regulator
MTSKKLKCLVVDDEPIGREIVERFVQQTANLELLASCEDAFDALDVLQNEPVDILFSDIQMPKVNGMELVKSLPHPPAVIFITAYDNFAAGSYDLNVVDYLLKPVSYQRFLKAVNKAQLYIDVAKKTEPTAGTDHPFIFVKANNRLNKVLLCDILYIESVKDYIKIHTPQSALMVYSTMKAMEEKLPVGKFYRIHQSYLVPPEQIKSLMGNMVELNTGASLPISKSHKSELYKMLSIDEG